LGKSPPAFGKTLAGFFEKPAGFFSSSLVSLFYLLVFKGKQHLF